MVKEELRELEKKMIGSVEHFRKMLTKLRTGRANISIFQDILVDYYGTPTPINQVATLGVPDPTLITVQPWETSMLATLDKAIRAADLGLNPISDGRVLKVPIPPLDEERRQEIARHIRKMLEERKTVVRNLRRETKDMIEMLEKEKEISEDDKFWGLEKMQEITDQSIRKLDEMAAAKEKEILEMK